MVLQWQGTSFPTYLVASGVARLSQAPSTNVNLA